MSFPSGVYGGAPAADAFLIVSMQKLGYLKLFYMTISVLQFPHESFNFCKLVYFMEELIIGLIAYIRICNRVERAEKIL